MVFINNVGFITHINRYKEKNPFVVSTYDFSSFFLSIIYMENN